MTGHDWQLHTIHTAVGQDENKPKEVEIVQSDQLSVLIGGCFTKR